MSVQSRKQMIAIVSQIISGTIKAGKNRRAYFKAKIGVKKRNMLSRLEAEPDKLLEFAYEISRENINPDSTRSLHSFWDRFNKHPSNSQIIALRANEQLKSDVVSFLEKDQPLPFDFEVYKAMMGFVHSDEFPDYFSKPESLVNLTKAADRYSIIPLMRRCQQAQLEDPSIDFKLSITTAFETHNSTLLSRCLNELIKEGPSQKQNEELFDSLMEKEENQEFYKQYYQGILNQYVNASNELKKNLF